MSAWRWTASFCTTFASLNWTSSARRRTERKFYGVWCSAQAFTSCIYVPIISAGKQFDSARRRRCTLGSEPNGCSMDAPNFIEYMAALSPTLVCAPCPCGSEGKVGVYLWWVFSQGNQGGSCSLGRDVGTPVEEQGRRPNNQNREVSSTAGCDSTSRSPSVCRLRVSLLSCPRRCHRRFPGARPLLSHSSCCSWRFSGRSVWTSWCPLSLYTRPRSP